MGWTYDASLTVKKDQVRFLLQDTVSTRQLLQDEEIKWVIATEANVYTAAALCADLLAAKFRGVKAKSVGGLSLTYGADEWKAVAAQLRMRGSTHMVPTAGGIEVADRDAIWENADLLRPSFFDRVLSDPQGMPAARGSDLTEEEQ